MIELVDELINKTKEYLQPNPTYRTKLMLSSKVVTAKSQAYPQPEGNLGEAMVRASNKLGLESNFGEKKHHIMSAAFQTQEEAFLCSLTDPIFRISF